MSRENNPPDRTESSLEIGHHLKLDPLGGEKALHVAAMNGDEEDLKMLLEAGCSVNDSHKGKKAIHVAAIYGHRKSVEILLQSGADIHSRTRFGETPLHLAAASGEPSLVKFLLDAGADPKLVTKRFLSPLEYALDTARHANIMRSTFNNSFLRSMTRDYTPNTGWNVSPFMFEKYLAITEMLLIKFGSGGAFYTFEDLFSTSAFNYACRIRVSNEDYHVTTSNSTDANKSKLNSTGVIFQPEIVRCILNYVINQNISNLELNYMIKRIMMSVSSMNTPQLIECLLEYDYRKLCQYIKIDCFKTDRYILIVIDHLVNVKVIHNLLYAEDVQQEVQTFRSFNNRRETTITNGNRRPWSRFLRMSTYMDTLKLLVARLVQIRSASKQSNNVLEPKELKILEDYNLREWYKECEIQLMNMRETKIHHNFDVSYYDILAQPVNKLANYVRRQELLESLEFSCMKFPAYAEFLKRSVEKGKRRKELIDSSADCLLNVIKKNHKVQLPSVVIDKIFDYLSVIDLLSMSQAGRPLYSCGSFAGRKNRK